MPEAERGFSRASPVAAVYDRRTVSNEIVYFGYVPWAVTDRFYRRG
jgi:hypothetical protein